ncbi:class I adenylate-forming enzyme family protein [Actinocorallia sp. A-T 12471]|uniref:class I adenylate-forming enzyme family protein n=1 Tax=Actinocorallia sp. A-T 12471 TaxID=3089813 RepID=UPI0029D1833A|nr:class I adenylate-forming enzyme family protein [Actinocorallia sp. A-T 12471]MDX6741172.1 class I adenylate-forming enzyme family protein [Actinocorallia sp. A-T 12471]
MHRGLHPAERVADYTARGWWSDETMDALFRARVAAEPDRVALVDPANKAALTGESPRRLTWREIDAETDGLADLLLSHGIGAGDIVGLQLPNTVELVVAYLACWRIGAVVSPLPVQYREREITGLGALAGFTAFLTAARVGERRPAEEITALRGDLPALRTVIAFGDGLPDGVVPVVYAEGAAERVAAHTAAHPADPNDCVTICWTSGTESTPKGVPRTHLDWLAMSWATVDAPRLTGDDVLLNPFPMVNMAGINGMFLPWLRVGGVLVQHHPFDLPTFLRQIEQEKATYTVAPPALLTMLLAREELLAATDLSSLRLIGSGSAPLAPPMVRGWQERHGIGIINFFGSNEGIALLTDPHDVPDPEERALYFPRFGAPGVTWSSRIAEQVSIRLVDPDTGELVTEPGVPGELRIKGPMVFPGYLGGEALASPFDADGYLKTGDVFVIAGEDGRFLRYVDRAKDLVIRGGMNIAPAELEGLLAGHPAVAEVAVVGYPDAVLGEKVCVVVVPRPGAEPELGDFVEFLRSCRIASYKLPERLELRAELPRNPVGKILKRDLRAELVAGEGA